MIEVILILILSVVPCWLIMWYIYEGWWRKVYTHDCGYTSEYFVYTCSSCGSTKGKAITRVGRRNILGQWEFKKSDNT